MKNRLLLFLVLVTAFILSAFFGNVAAGTSSNSPETKKTHEVSKMRIRLTAGETVVTAIMRDNDTSRDFMALLPLTLTLKDYNGTEKISDLPKRLSTEGAPSGSDPSVADITY
jgi:hypothetical protein